MTDEPSIGHNSNISKEARDRLKSIVDRVERLAEERKGIGDDIKDVMNEAKSAGFDMKALRRTLKARQQTPEEVKDETDHFETLCRALGMGSYLE